MLNAFKMEDHKVPAEFEYEGIRWPGMAFSVKMLDESRKLKLTPEDIIVATYPKSGRFQMLKSIYVYSSLSFSNIRARYRWIPFILQGRIG